MTRIEGPFTAHHCAESQHYKDEADRLRLLLGELDRSNESLTDEIDQLRAKLATAERERDEAVQVATAAVAWSRAGGNPCGECDDPYLCTECALFHAAQAWRTKGDASK